MMNNKFIKITGLIVSVMLMFMLAGCDLLNNSDDKKDDGTPVTGDEEVLTGPISSNRTLGVLYGRKNYVYNGSSMLAVQNSAVLTILPGTTIRFSNPNGGIRIDNGSALIAEGLPKLLDSGGSIIQIGGVDLDGHIKLYGGTGKGYWTGLAFSTSTENRLKYVDIVNAGRVSNNAVIYLGGGSYIPTLYMDYCLIDGGNNLGIDVNTGNAASSIKSFTYNTIKNCKIPIWVRGITNLRNFDNTSDYINNEDNTINVSTTPPLSGNMDLWPSKIPYRLTGTTSNHNISAGAVLTIKPGVTFWMDASTSIVADGAILAQGTAGEGQITFTRPQGSLSTWNFIRVRADSSSSFTHCLMEYGGLYRASSNDTGIFDVTQTGSTVTLNNVTIQHSQSVGVSFQAGAKSITATDVTFNDLANGHYSVTFSPTTPVNNVAWSGTMSR